MRPISCATRAFLCVASLLALASNVWSADNELTPEEKAAGWQLLFNGKDHTGWKCNNNKPIATPVEDGALLPFKSGGYLIVNEKQFGDFIFQCDVKMDKEHCNSGIFLRIGNLGLPVYTGIEVQIEENDSGNSPYHAFGSIYDLVPVSKDNTKEPGEWNHVQITCKGPEITVEVNGEIVSKMNCDDFNKRGQRPDGSKHKFGKAIKDMPRKGYLGFQDHGHKVWFKNVKIKELDAST
ncbi:MAG: DUF1080 domain-containing protein [Planctomycetota bacterium]